MNLGERIYQYRMNKKLSQGDLAELLNVSRQSISKWENNTATPDLDKIVKMSEIFGVSLDELIKGEMSSTYNKTIQEEKVNLTNVYAQITTVQRVTGIILLCMAFLVVLVFMAAGSIIAGLLFASPFIACGIICLKCKRNAGLWCAWAMYLLITAYLIWATGITWSAIYMTLLWEPSMNYLRLATAWALFISLVLLIIKTVKKFSNNPFDSLKEGTYKTSIVWITYVVLRVAYKLIYNVLRSQIIVNGELVGDYGFITLCTTIFDCLKLPLITVALIYTVRLFKTYRATKK